MFMQITSSFFFSRPFDLKTTIGAAPLDCEKSWERKERGVLSLVWILKEARNGEKDEK